MDLISRLRRRLLGSQDSTSFSIRLPASSGRFCTAVWRDNQYYLASALRDSARLVCKAGLNEQTRLLDVGCGQGRLAIGLQLMFPTLRYEGVDVDERSIQWCRKHLGRETFSFHRLDLQNARYNPKGRPLGPGFLPFEEESFDLFNLYSVFTHMNLADVEVYLREMRRVAARDATVFLTIYVEDGVADEEANPPGYLSDLIPEYSGPLHQVLFNRERIERLCAETGFRVSDFQYRSEPPTKQSTYVLAARPRSDH